MLAYFSVVALAIWILTMAAQFWVTALLRKGSTNAFPAFRAYLYLCTIGNPLTFLVAIFLKPQDFIVAYYVLTLSTDILAFFVAREIYSKVFGPKMALPRFVPERTAAMMAISFTGSALFVVVLHATKSWFWSKLLLTTEQVLAAAAFAVFWILFTYSRSLRIRWPKRALDIWTGFALSLTVSIIAVFLRARGSASVAIAADRAAQIAALLAVAWWGWRLRGAEEVVVAMTREQVREMRDHHDHTIEGLGKAGIL